MSREVGWCVSTALGWQYYKIIPFLVRQPKEQRSNPFQKLHHLKTTKKCNIYIFTCPSMQVSLWLHSSTLTVMAQNTDGCTQSHIHLKTCMPRVTPTRKTQPNYLCLNISKLGIAKMWVCINARGGRQRREGFKFSISIGIRIFQCSLRNEDFNSLE